eukprot:TRINITY_DN22358_c0_g1_i1.p1 TRINITY_DN22358_c0_g1~~TRINITY_DN22358_c0_g1_i1.p1  ORF type:complete len:583 (-),score=127.65 TRINITY_DN22358_c0_g1_i1:15-1763(-)
MSEGQPTTENEMQRQENGNEERGSESEEVGNGRHVEGDSVSQSYKQMTDVEDEYSDSSLTEEVIDLDRELGSRKEEFNVNVRKSKLLGDLYFYWNNLSLFFKICLLSLPSASQGWMWDKNQYVVSYFLGLGMSNNVASINDIIGALAGLTVGMAFGSASDTCTSRWGRRRPFLAWGLVTSIICHQIISFAPEIGRLLGDPEPTGGSVSCPIAIGIMLPFYFLSDFTQNIMQIPQLAIVADFAGERQASAQMIRIIIASLFGRIFSSFVAIFDPTTSIQKMHVFFFVVDIASVILHVICYLVADEKVYEKAEGDENKSCVSSITSVFKDTVVGLKELPRSIISLGICFIFAAFAVAANLKYLPVTGQLTYHGDSYGAATCGQNCTLEQRRFNEGNNVAAQILTITGWVCFFLNFIFLVIIEPLLIHWGIGKCYAVVLFCASCVLYIPFTNIYLSGFFEFLCLFALQMTWQLPAIAVAMYCYAYKIDKISLYNSTLNSMGCFGNVTAGILNTFFSSGTWLGFGITFVISGIFSLLSIILSLGIPNFVIQGTQIEKFFSFEEFKSCKPKKVPKKFEKIEDQQQIE